MKDPARLKCSSMHWAVMVMLIASSSSQAQDSVYRVKTGAGPSKASGKITEIRADGVTIDGDDISVAEIRKIVFSKEPSGLGRARDQMESGRYSDCIRELDKIKAPLRGKRIPPELEFLRAYSNSQISLRGGNVTAQSAGKEIGAFIKNNPTSYHLYPAKEQYAKQLYAIGRLDLAVEEYDQLADVSWSEYQLRGLLGKGMVLTDLERFPEATASFDAILQMQSKDDLTQAYQLYAQCEKAKIVGLQGDVEASEQVIEGLIRDQNSEHKRLFAHINNALGAVYEKSDNLKKARMAYMKTQLLFHDEPGLHAEALYHLALIWPKLGKTDEASSAREQLKTRYRNSYWAGKL